jgi:hypothetical protein
MDSRDFFQHYLSNLEERLIGSDLIFCFHCQLIRSCMQGKVFGIEGRRKGEFGKRRQYQHIADSSSLIYPSNDSGNVEKWCVPMSSASQDGIPLLAVGCGEEIHVLTMLDGGDTMNTIYCLYPRAGEVVALEWATKGRRLACCTEREILVYSLRSLKNARKSSPKFSFAKEFDQVQYDISHRISSSGHCSVSWGVLAQDCVLMTGGSSSVIWKVESPEIPADVFSVRNRESNLIPWNGLEKEGKADARGLIVGQDGPDIMEISDSHQLALSPDSRWIASFTAFGRIVTVKHSPHSDVCANTGRVIFLPHTQAVLSIEWRPFLEKKGHKTPSCICNVLLTCCQDGCARIWKETLDSTSSENSLNRQAFGLAPVSSFTLSFAVGADLHRGIGISDTAVSAASWVLDAIPGYESTRANVETDAAASLDGQDRRHDATHGGAEGDDIAHKEPEADSEEYALLATIAGSHVCLWTVSGIASRSQPAVNLSCALRTDLASVTANLSLPIAGIRVFRCGLSAGYRAGAAADKSRVALVLTDAMGLLISVPLALSHTSTTSADPKATNVYADDCSTLSTMHFGPCRMLAAGHPDTTVLADPDGLLSFWRWDANLAGNMSRQPLAFGGSTTTLHSDDDGDGDGGVTVACCESWMLVVRANSHHVTLVHMYTSSGEGDKPRISARQHASLSRTTTGPLHDLSLFVLAGCKWLCAAGLTPTASAPSNLWCACFPLSGSSSNASHHVPLLPLRLNAASVEDNVTHLTCIHVPENLQTSAETRDTDGGTARAFLFAGDKLGFISLLCVTLLDASEESDSDSGSAVVSAISRFGDSSLGATNVVRALSLDCLASSHAEDPHAVYVWQAAVSCESFHQSRRVVVPGVSVVHSLAWLEPLPLTRILAAATDSSVHVLMPPLTLVSDDNKLSKTSEGWGVAWSAQMPDCLGLLWTSDGILLVNSTRGLLALEPGILQQGNRANGVALTSSGGYAGLRVNASGSLQGLGGPSHAHTLHQLLRDTQLQPVPLSCARRLHLLWSAGNTQLLHATLSRIHGIVVEEGVGSWRIQSEASMAHAEWSQGTAASHPTHKSGDVATCFGESGFGFSQGLAASHSSGVYKDPIATVCKALMEAVSDARGSGNTDVCPALLNLLPTLQALYAAAAETADKLDLPAQRFMFAVALQSAASSRSPDGRTETCANQLQQPQEAGREIASPIRAVDMAWALLSGEQETLVRKLIPDDATWEHIRCLGAPLWITSPSTLKAVAERLSRAQFKRDKDPTQCALLYLCLDKRTTLTAMFKAVKNETLHAFFSRDFGQEQHRVAALKNACVLLSQHRYQLAAAFFLLAGQVNDALDAVLNKMGDPMLAMFVARLCAKSDTGTLYNDAMSMVVSKWQAEAEGLGACLVLWKLGRFSDALSSLATSAETRTRDSLTLVQALAIFSFMRADPRVRLALAEQRNHGVAGNNSNSSSLFRRTQSREGLQDTPDAGGDEPQPLAGAEANKLASAAGMVMHEMQARQIITRQMAAEGFMDLALQQCKVISTLQQTLRTAQDQDFEMAAAAGCACSSDVARQAHRKRQDSARRAFEELVLWHGRCSVAERAVRAVLPLTPDYVHPSTLQARDPPAVVQAFQDLCQSLSSDGMMDAAVASLVGAALHECRALSRVDCHMALALGAGAASDGFAHLTSLTLTVPHALRTLPVTERSADAASHMMKLAQRFTAAATIMAQACGQPAWLGDCLNLDAKHRRLCLATFLCALTAFWHSCDSAGLQQLLCAQWEERGSKASDCSMALASYAHRALARTSVLHR